MTDARQAAISARRHLAPAAEYIHHLSGCPSIGGHGDSDCTCGAVQFLALVEDLSKQLSSAVSSLADLLSTQQEPHRCARCGHRWEGLLSGAEYCGDCHRANQAQQDKTKVDAAIHESTVRVLQDQRDTLRKRNEELLAEARQGWQPIRQLIATWREEARRVRPLECAPLSAEKRERMKEWMFYTNRASELEALLPAPPVTAQEGTD